MAFFDWVNREGDWFLENVDDAVWKAYDALDQYQLWMTRAAYQRLVGDTAWSETVAGFRARRDDIAALAPGTPTPAAP